MGWGANPISLRETNDQREDKTEIWERHGPIALVREHKVSALGWLLLTKLLSCYFFSHCLIRSMV